eukprot:TRINITY_DN9552_c0_g1_i3.p1 TRINITY_DN9552_c0_g1~~TRINITY_DN9552_c0_g1_i3.p1  ORF type:complete len:247 (+),score=45.83 TRINITY_DN9552_c0_g1_i3:67-741(+)
MADEDELRVEVKLEGEDLVHLLTRDPQLGPVLSILYQAEVLYLAVAPRSLYSASSYVSLPFQSGPAKNKNILPQTDAPKFASCAPTVSHLARLMAGGALYCVESSVNNGRQLIKIAQEHREVVPILEDASRPQKYRMLVNMVDLIISELEQADKKNLDIIMDNALRFLKERGFFVLFFQQADSPELLQEELGKYRGKGLAVTHVSFLQQPCSFKVMVVANYCRS